ncbi:mitochondrial-processing peptidase subunit alpha-like isoform X2 [Eurosta solidaginis]|uniref:mitochondrial-processing peptidase subunit alpha-like isoform X2 n=1 Tax=Eurosta solidaginis TaxID=178769 RepID=UPI0035305A83
MHFASCTKKCTEIREFCTVRLVIDSGPCYEVTYTTGASYFLEKLAFNSTDKFPNKDAVLKELEKNGGRYNPHTNTWSPIVAMTSRRSGVALP